MSQGQALRLRVVPRLDANLLARVYLERFKLIEWSILATLLYQHPPRAQPSLQQ